MFVFQNMSKAHQRRLCKWKMTLTCMVSKQTDQPGKKPPRKNLAPASVGDLYIISKLTSDGVTSEWLLLRVETEKNRENVLTKTKMLNTGRVTHSPCVQHFVFGENIFLVLFSLTLFGKGRKWYLGSDSDTVSMVHSHHTRVTDHDPFTTKS